MNYQVLARKWRPRNFSDVVGQEHVLTALANSFSLGRIHHSYLFSGIRGVGKTSIARLLAKGINCKSGITIMPCSICDNCREIEQGYFIDLIEIDAASRTKVEDTRELLDNIQYSPVRGRFKIYLIDEAHMLSRQSFNALLKAFEEPPSHVKFLLATTNPQKLPVTILSRCLQFHLQALDVEQIYNRLKNILNAENITYESRSLRLLARAANGSMRDALTLTDQAIVSSNGRLTTKSVSDMLGILDSDQALSLIESIIDANGEQTFFLINEAASHGIEWESLLIEMLSLLHHLAMLQLSPSASVMEIDIDIVTIKHRLQKLACTVSPADVQLYYQILLIGRKELPFAPDKRMGVEMTLLRALAFHPYTPLSESEEFRRSLPSVSQTTMTESSKIYQQEMFSSKSDTALSETTSSILSARSKLQFAQKETRLKKVKQKKSELVILDKVQSIRNTVFDRLPLLTERVELRPILSVSEQEISERKEEIYFWRENAIVKKVKVNSLEALKILEKVAEHEKRPEIVEKLTEEVIACDSWSAEVSQLHLPKPIEQVALNAWKEQKGNQIYLHLRSDKQHLNSPKVKKELAKAIAISQGISVKLTIIEDDNLTVRTPMEWRQAIYEKKLAQAREVIFTDNNIQSLRQFFDADLDEESIRPTKLV